MKPRDLALILAIDLIWGLNIVAVKVAVESAQPLTAVLLRYAIVLAVTLPWLRWLPGRMATVLATGLVAGAAFMGLSGLSFALADNVSALAIAGQLGVPFSLLLAVMVFKERIHWIRVTAVIISFAGVAVMGFDPAIIHERLGLVLTIAAAFCWAAGNLLFRRLKGVAVPTIHAWLALVSLPVLLAGSLVFEPGALARVPDLPATTWAWLAYSAIGASLIGHGGMSRLFQRYPVSTVSPLTLPTPLLSVIVAVMAFHTPITAQMLAGGALTLLGVAVITLRTAQARDNSPE